MTVDLSRLKNNALEIKRSCGLIAVVKCNAYGHGDIECAEALKDIADAFAVATTEEALRLVRVGITNDVLILSQNYDGANYPDNVIFCAFDMNSLKRLVKSKRRYAIKIDTGMNRLGFSSREFLSVANEINYDKVHSVFSHIYDNSAAVRQYNEFRALTDSLDVKRHIFASNCVFAAGDLLNYVRPGLLLYGYGADYVKPVMKLSARVLQVRRVRAGRKRWLRNLPCGKRRYNRHDRYRLRRRLPAKKTWRRKVCFYRRKEKKNSRANLHGYVYGGSGRKRNGRGRGDNSRRRDDGIRACRAMEYHSVRRFNLARAGAREEKIRKIVALRAVLWYNRKQGVPPCSIKTYTDRISKRR